MSTVRIGFAVGLFLLAAPASVLSARQQASPPLEVIGDLLVGSWSGEGVYAADYPGIGKKGEKFTSRHTCRWLVARAALGCEGSENQGSWTALYWWDAASKQVKYLGINSGGNWAEGTVARQGDRLVWASAGSLSDGQKVEYRGETTFEDNGNTQIATGATILNGVSNPFRDVYKRVATE